MFRTLFPGEELSSRVESILIVDSDEGMTNLLPPNPAPVLAFRLRGVTAEQFADREEAVPRLALTGINHAPRVMRYHPGAAMLLVRFHPGGADGLLDVPLEELAGRTLSLDSLISPRSAHELAAKLEETPRDAAQASVLLSFLAEKLRSRALDPLVERTLREICRSHGQAKVGDLVRNLATNPDTLEKRFRRSVGASPKLFSRIVRFQSFVSSYSEATNLTEAALRAGFYDHAHLVKEFQSFTGLSPKGFLQRPRHW